MWGENVNRPILKIKRYIDKSKFSEAVEIINNGYEQLEERVHSLQTKCDDLQAKLNDSMLTTKK